MIKLYFIFQGVQVKIFTFEPTHNFCVFQISYGDPNSEKKVSPPFLEEILLEILKK